jgi:choice-of-anchor B domain-containing protein
MKLLYPFTAVFMFICMLLPAQNVNLVFRAQLKYPGMSLANIWGYVDAKGNEYALVGTTEGLSIVDVTVPTKPMEVKAIAGATGTKGKWREVKSYKGYAYVVSEAGGGLEIVDLRGLPDTSKVTSKYWQPSIGGKQITSIHALHVDTTKGFVYLYGSNLANGGAVVGDLKDPWNPTLAGYYDTKYIHDGYVDNDTLYGGHIYDGYFSVIDFTNKSKPKLLQTQNTPNKFTHNTWPLKGNKTLLTTDEKSNSFLTAYDLSDLNNITELDRIQSNPGSNSIVHNTHVKNEWAITSWYKDGVTIVDAHKPDNLIQVANYDTYSGAGDGFSGAWGVYPFLPSGNLIVSNIGEGLFVLSPTYVRACYLEGIISDSVCGTLLDKVKIEITATNVVDSTNINGIYKTGYHLPGKYTVKFSKPGYQTRTMTNVSLTAGNVTILNLKMLNATTANIQGKVVDAISKKPIAGAFIELKNDTSTIVLNTDAQGNFSACNSPSGSYVVTAGKWRYVSSCKTIPLSSSSGPILFELKPGYYDDFTFDFGWKTTGNASTGKWTRAVPKGTTYNNKQANPGEDASIDCSNKAFVTGNAGKSSSDDDVSNGNTILTSPVIDLSAYSNPYLNFHTWFFNAASSGKADDTLWVSMDNGTQSAIIDTITVSSQNSSQWIGTKINIKQLLPLSSTMKLLVSTSNTSSNIILEAGWDAFAINDSIVQSAHNPAFIAEYMNVYPNPSATSFTLQYRLKSTNLGNTHLTIRNMLGQIVEQHLLLTDHGNLTTGEELRSGVYLIQLINAEGQSDAIRVVKME